MKRTNFLDEVYVVPGRKHPILVLGGYDYTMEYTRERRSFWSCTRKKNGCKARLVANEMVVSLTGGDHNHPATLGDQRRSKLIRLEEYGVENLYCKRDKTS